MTRATLMKLVSSFTQSPDRNACAITLLLVALSRSFCAACSLAGAAN